MKETSSFILKQWKSFEVSCWAYPSAWKAERTSVCHRGQFHLVFSDVHWPLMALHEAEDFTTAQTRCFKDHRLVWYLLMKPRQAFCRNMVETMQKHGLLSSGIKKMILCAVWWFLSCGSVALTRPCKVTVFPCASCLSGDTGSQWWGSCLCIHLSTPSQAWPAALRTASSPGSYFLFCFLLTTLSAWSCSLRKSCPFYPYPRVHLHNRGLRDVSYNLAPSRFALLLSVLRLSCCKEGAALLSLR